MGADETIAVVCSSKNAISLATYGIINLSGSVVTLKLQRELIRAVRTSLETTIKKNEKGRY